MINVENFYVENFLIFNLNEVESTNDLAKSLIKNQQLLPNQIILAKTQTKGRGRLDRQWQSPIGNLYFSIFLQNNLPLANNNQLSFVASCALNQTVSKIAKNDLQIQNKWPNDLLINQKKVAGIMIEGESITDNLTNIILGIGVNLMSHPQNSLFLANNLQNLKINITPIEFLKIFLPEFQKIYNIWLNFGFKNIRELWLKNAYKIGEEIKISCSKINEIGIFTGVSDDGCIILNANNIDKKINYGDVS